MLGGSVAVHTTRRTKKQSARSFLLSVAGMLPSEHTDTSENVNAIVSEMILKKHGFEV